MAKASKLENLRKGDVVDLWDRTRGDNSTVESVTVTERSGFRYDRVDVVMKDGTRLTPMSGNFFTTFDKVGVTSREKGGR